MSTQIAATCLDQLFHHARTAKAFLDKPVPLELLKRIYDTARMGPTSMNTQPTRHVFLISPEARARLLTAMSPGNLDKTRSAPVTVIIANDTMFQEHLATQWHGANARDGFDKNEALRRATATRNGTLGGAYFMLAARAFGLSCGPMSGFDTAQVNAEFFPDGRFEANFLCNLGYGDDSKLLERNPRLEFDVACTVL
jgi:nitroreductase